MLTIFIVIPNLLVRAYALELLKQVYSLEWSISKLKGIVPMMLTE
jgi:hypothetical protein